LVGRVTEEDVSHGGLARTIGAHQGVHAARFDGEVHPPKDGYTVHGNVEILDLEQRDGLLRGFV
jgi:hypothetical protein